MQPAVIWYGVFDFAALAAERSGGAHGGTATLLGRNGVCRAENFVPATSRARNATYNFFHTTLDGVVQ